MSTRIKVERILALVFACLLAVPAWATGTVLSGVFDGGEPAVEPLSAEFPCANYLLGYQQARFGVSTSGTYYFHDAYGTLAYAGGLDVTAVVYEGLFDPADPGRNVAASGGGDHQTEVSLTSGTDYILVVQRGCRAREGAWAVTFTGAGAVSSELAATVPPFTSGVFDADAPTRESECSDAWGPYEARYQQSGPIRVAQDGTYYFSDSGDYALCLSAFTAPFDPAQPRANLVAASGWGRGLFELRAGQDYYFVVDHWTGDEDFEYFYVLAPSAPFRINPGLADAWYNPQTPGQGFFLDIFENRNEAFLGWFTFAPDSPVGDGAGHRWVTAYGAFSGTSAELAIEWTGGGGFDSAEPEPVKYLDGSIELEFTDCASGRITYRWGFDGSGTPRVSGVIPIQRMANHSVALCDLLYRGPGTPGPL